MQARWQPVNAGSQRGTCHVTGHFTGSVRKQTRKGAGQPVPLYSYSVWQEAAAGGDANLPDAALSSEIAHAPMPFEAAMFLPLDHRLPAPIDHLAESTAPEYPSYQLAKSAGRRAVFSATGQET